MTPAENRSERRSTAAPRRCSGDMYGSVPRTAAVWVSRVTFGPVSSSASRCAMPKSASCAPSAPSSTFAGLRSRWTTPRSCACASAANSRPKTAAVSGGGSAPVAMRARRSLPATSAIANHGVPSCVPCASTRTMAGCSRRVSVAISRAKRATTSGLSASAGARNFSATARAAVDRGRAVDGSHPAAAQARVDPVAADVGSGAVDLGHEARAARNRAGARDVDLRRAGCAGDHRVCVRGKGRVASGAEQVQRRAPILLPP